MKESLDSAFFPLICTRLINSCLKVSKRLQCRSPWAQLPNHLLILVASKLEGGDSLKTILSLQRVCKAWRAALVEYNGHIKLTVKRSTDLFKLRKSLPCLQGLSIRNRPPYYRHPISAFSHFSSLTLRNWAGQTDKALDLTLLPPSLKAELWKLLCRFCRF